MGFAQSKGLLLMKTCQKREADAIRAAGYTPVFTEAFENHGDYSNTNCDISVNIYLYSKFSGEIEYPIARLTKDDDETLLSIKEWRWVQGQTEKIKLEQLKSFMTDSMDYLNKVDKPAAQAMTNMKNRILPKINEIENLRSDFDDEIVRDIASHSGTYTIYLNDSYTDREEYFTHEFSNKEAKAFDRDKAFDEEGEYYISINEIKTLIQGYEFGYIEHKLSTKPRKCENYLFESFLTGQKTGKCYDITTTLNIPTERGITKEKWEYEVYVVSKAPKSREAVINNLSNAYAKLLDVIIKEDREKRLLRDKVREIIEAKMQRRTPKFIKD